MNLQNYLIMDRRVDNRWVKDYPKPEVEKAALRRAVLEINPDILAVQEMGPGLLLREFQEDLEKEGQVFPYMILMEGEDEERHVAVLSKIEPLEVIPHRDMDFPYFGERMKMKRGLLEVVFPQQENGEDFWSLFVVHLKSRLTDNDSDPDSRERREKEARAARDRILEQFPNGDGYFLVVGDFNDHRDSASLRRFANRGDTQITRMIDAFDSRGEKWTYHYEKFDRYERVDFFLASTDLSRCVKGAEGKILDSFYWRVGTDHRPIFLDLDFGQ
ncbi:MAG: endonuclease/exonuclease/phosphatase family protein [Verrucomicrobiota bacterium]